MKRKLLSGVILVLFILCMLSLGQEIKPARSTWIGTVYIRADGSLDPSTAPIQRVDDIYTLTDNIVSNEHGIVVERDNILIDGAGYAVQGSGAMGWAGVSLNSRVNVTIKNIRITTFYLGIYVHTSSNINITENHITGNDQGICIDSSSSNSINSNSIINNNWGISLGASSSNDVSKNTIANNTIGVYITWYENYDNNFWHNNFIDNSQQCYNQYGYSTSVWDDGYPSGGNYWSDYNGVDLYKGPNQDQYGSDGVGDTPYIIDSQNRDNYPLMYPYGSPPPPYYNLTITTTIGGTTEPPAGTYSYMSGTTVNVTAFPDIGYSFDYWLFDGQLRTENPITITMDVNHTLGAHFIDDIKPEISEPWQDPPIDNVQPYQNVTVRVNVTDYGSGIKNVTLWYSLNNGTSWTIINMTELPIPSDMTITYEATISGYENCTWITYKIIAYDKAGNNQTKDNNHFYYKYHVIPEFPSSVALLGLFTLITIPIIFTLKNHPPKTKS